MTTFVGIRTFRGRHTFTGVVGVKTSCLSETLLHSSTHLVWMTSVLIVVTVWAKTNDLN